MFSSTYFFALCEDCMNFFMYSNAWYFSAIMLTCIIIALFRKILHLFD